MEGAVNEDSDIYEVIWVGQVELHSCTAHWDVSGAQFSGGSSDAGRDCTISGITVCTSIQCKYNIQHLSKVVTL